MYFTAETAERAKLIATIKKGNATEKEKARLAALELAEKKKQAELDSLKKKFDVERINLETALANSKDEAEKARIRSLLTIMDEDANSAAKRMAELDKANAERLRKELEATKSINDLAIAASLAAAKIGSLPSTGFIPGISQSYPNGFGDGGAVGEEINPNISNYPATGMIPGSSQVYPGDFGEGGVAGMAAVNNITINTPLGSEDALTEAVQKAVQQLNRYGYSQSYAGALPTP
jgi:multidrug efflux pump subunit AcrA (membrane-fusion protein)